MPVKPPVVLQSHSQLLTNLRDAPGVALHASRAVPGILVASLEKSQASLRNSLIPEIFGLSH